jgi:hypothetical protein
MRSWKTTLIGFIAGFLNLGLNGVSIKSILLSAAVAALGTFAKDYNVSGTSSSNKDSASK